MIKDDYDTSDTDEKSEREQLLCVSLTARLTFTAKWTWLFILIKYLLPWFF
jgi:hypothetical protein